MRISSVGNSFTLSNQGYRKPKGFGISPYPFLSLIRYIVNTIFNGYFSYINPDHSKMRLLSKEGRITRKDPSEPTSSLKIDFLGDIMVSRSGKSPQFSIVVANIESPVVNSDNL